MEPGTGLRRLILGVLAMLAVAAPAVTEARAGGDVRFGYETFVGDFGSDFRNRLWEAPLSLSVTRPRSRFTITVPYIGIDRTGNVTLTADGPIILGVGRPGRPSFQESAAGDGQGGLGDVVLTDELALVMPGKVKRPFLALVLDLKLPTADRKKGLGTGERDYGAGLSYVQPFGKVVQFLADATYRVMGDPKGIDFKDRPKFSAGLAFVVNRATLRALYETMRPALDKVPVFDAAGNSIGVEAIEDRQIARADLTIRSLSGGSTRLGLTKGLNKDSGDLGFIVEFSTGGR